MNELISKEIWVKTVIIPTLFVYLIVGWGIWMAITFPEKPIFEDDPFGTFLLCVFLLSIVVFFPISQYQSALRKSDGQLEKEAVDAFIADQKEKETITLSLTDIENILIETGQRDFWITAFYLHRYGQLKNQSEDQ